MMIPIEYDGRYKVTQEKVDLMRLYRNKAKLSYSKIARKMGLSNWTVKYWCNDSFRKKERERFKDRRCLSTDLKYQRRKLKQKAMWKQFPLTYIAFRITQSKNKNVKKMYGKPISFWEKLLKNAHYYKQSGLAKIK